MIEASPPSSQWASRSRSVLRVIVTLVTVVCFLAVASMASSCVPATVDEHPRGAILVQTEPSAGSRGEPFVTADGWTVTVEALVVQVFVMGITTQQTNDDDTDIFGHPTGDVLFSVAQPHEMLTFGVRAGPAVAQVVFSIHGVGYGEINNPHHVDDALVERFKKHPDVAYEFQLPPGVPKDTQTVQNFGGPSFLVIARAEKAGRVVRLDVALQDELAPSSNLRATVIANELVKVRAMASAENLFMKEEDGPMMFDEIADADTNGDGMLSPDELHEAKERCDDCTAEEKSRPPHSIAKALARRANHIFIPPPSSP